CWLLGSLLPSACSDDAPAGDSSALAGAGGSATDNGGSGGSAAAPARTTGAGATGSQTPDASAPSDARAGADAGGSSPAGRGSAGAPAGTGGTQDAPDAATTDASADGGAGEPLARCTGGGEPPASWQEHWFEHDQALSRVYYDDCVAVYFDADVDREQAQWLFSYMSRIWEYSLATYGPMGEERLFAIFHQGKYGGGHPSYWYDDSHDNRNVTDQGGGNWREGAYDVASHEVGHIVESTAPYPRRTSPAFGLWMDSKWIEIYQYDLYLALGMDEHAATVFERFSATSDDFPRAGTHWFRDWFHPLWRDHGGAAFMTRFFQLLQDHYRGGGMNWGQYVHFSSGAAGTDLKALATEAFGWEAQREREWLDAREDYPAVTY
ncbi:MAG TPA: hypothetical protein VK509_08175, partial [Polyangiales bacterium]|nr:hypothetical protein [Polyangiales bacterium]